MLRSSLFGVKEQASRLAIAPVCVGVVCALIGIGLLSCGGNTASIPTSPGGSGQTVALTTGDVSNVITAAAMSVNVPIVVAVTDRLGNVLGVYDDTGAPSTGQGNFYDQMGAPPTVDANNLAVALARTASFFSNDQAPLSSRTVRYISGIHFPPDVDNAPNAALYGIENTNRGCTLDPSLTQGAQVAKGTMINGSTPGLGVLTGKSIYNDQDPNIAFPVNPGGVPIFKMDPTTNETYMVGGVGVVASAAITGGQAQAYAVAEYAAFSGADAGGGLTPVPVPLPPPGAVLINGVTLPFVNQTTIPPGVSAATSMSGSYFTSFTCPDGSTPNTTCNGVIPMGDMAGQDGAFLLSARPGSILSASDVMSIVNNTIATAKATRAVIRLPLESRTRMSIAVSDVDGTLLALYRMNDGTIFSIDVAATKSKNAVYFSSTASTVATDLPGVPPGTAVTNRTIGFGAQPLFPPGINGSNAGPFYNLYLNDIANACTQGSQSPPIASPSGIVFFPGSLALYNANGTMVGGLGVSGDGVDQDDYVTNGGAVGFYAPSSITRADQIVIENVRLPYQNFPRDPTD